jgi:hypothetical protein
MDDTFLRMIEDHTKFAREWAIREREAAEGCSGYGRGIHRASARYWEGIIAGLESATSFFKVAKTLEGGQ